MASVAPHGLRRIFGEMMAKKTGDGRWKRPEQQDAAEALMSVLNELHECTWRHALTQLTQVRVCVCVCVWAALLPQSVIGDTI